MNIFSTRQLDFTCLEYFKSISIDFSFNKRSPYENGSDNLGTCLEFGESVIRYMEINMTQIYGV